MSAKSRFSLLLSIFVFILINSCDDNIITFDSGDSGVNYYEQSFVLNLEKSLFLTEPFYHIDDSLFNQSLAPRLYLGDIGLFEEENLSYALFQFDPNIINNYNICDPSLVSINDVLFKLKFDDLNIQYMVNDDSSHISQNSQIANNNSSYNFSDSGIEEVDSSFAIVQTPYYIKSYIYHEAISFSEEDSINYDEVFISELLMNIKSSGSMLQITRSSEYVLDLHLMNNINIDDWCDGNFNDFYILIEYNPPIGSEHPENLTIISTDNYYGPYQPKLRVEHEHSLGNIDVLMGSVIDIDTVFVGNETVFLTNEEIHLLGGADDAPIIDCTLCANGECGEQEDGSSCPNIDGNNMVAINRDRLSSEFGTFLGYQSPDISSPPIIPITDADIELFDIKIEIDQDFDSDSIRFYFSDIIFGYQDVNYMYDFGEAYEDYGIDQCPNNLETGDSLLVEFSSENFCLCGIDVGLWNGSECDEGSFTTNSWDSELLLCYKDNNADLSYNLCGTTETAYNPEGTENNGTLDWNDDDDDGVWEEGEGEEWLDLGLDWLKGTIFFGADDDYETGCKTPSYPYGIGYLGDETETYSLIVDEALETGLINSLDFYNFFYEINDGSTVEFCGPQFWSNSLIDGISACLTCRNEDPNGDNINSDPNNDDWKNDLCDDCNDNDEWDHDDTDDDEIIDDGEYYEPLEGNNQWDWIDMNGNGIFDYCFDMQGYYCTDGSSLTEEECCDNNAGDWDAFDEISGQCEGTPTASWDVCDSYEPFLDFGINQLPDHLEGENFANDNYDINPSGTENNSMYDLGEQFFDTGVDGLYSYQEDNYNGYGRQGNKEVDFDADDNTISEFKDYGLDNCPNSYESEDGLCDTSTENLYYYDLHFDDYDIDPNDDNYTFNNILGTENNSSWDYEDADDSGTYDIDEEIVDEYDNEEDCLLNNNIWEGTFCYIDSNMDGEYTTTELSEDFFEYDNPLVAFTNVGQNSYYYNLLDGTDEQIYDKPANDPIYGQDVFLWISKIVYLENNKYLITISINSFIDVKGFQFKLNHGPYYEQIDGGNELRSTEMIAYDFDDINENNEPDADEINVDIKYIHDVSMYPFINYSSFDDDEMILSYAYGMTGKLYFDDLNYFINQNNQSVFVAEQQTHLTLSFDILSDNHNIEEEGVQINFTGNIGDLILIEDFVSPQYIYNDTEEILVPIGKLLNEILEKSEQLFLDSDDVLDTIMYHLEISLDSYSNIFTTVVIDELSLPQIDIFYSE